MNCGAALEPRTIEGRELEACPNDGFVLWHDPKVATAVVVEAGGGIVLGRRGIEPGYGLWCLPGGFVNDDEDPAQAAERECREEIGAAVEVIGLLGVHHIAKSDAPSMVAIAYRARLARGAVPSAGSEMLEAGVFSLDALPPLAFSSHRQVLADYVRAVAPSEPVTPRPAGSPGEPGRRPSRSPARRTPPHRR